MAIVSELHEFNRLRDSLMRLNGNYTRQELLTADARRDARIVMRRMRVREMLEQERTLLDGDVIMVDGQPRRVASIWTTYVDTIAEGYEAFQLASSGTFHLSEQGTMSFSGSLDVMQNAKLRFTGEYMLCPAWIFSGGYPVANGGVSVDVSVRVFECEELSDGSASQRRGI